MNTSFRKSIFISIAVLIFSLAVGPRVAFAQNTTSIISSWNGDVVSEETAADMEDGNNGTILGGATTVPEKNGNVFKFDGSSGRINMGNPASLNFGTTGPFSLEAWFNWDGGGESSAINIVRKSNYPVDGPGAGYWLRIGRDTSVLEFYIGETVGVEGDYSRGAVSTPIDPNTWYHAVATRDSAGNMKLYVNDELKGTAKAPNADTTSEAPFTIGAWDDRFGVTELFSGMIGEVTVYAGALNSTEVKSADAEDPNKLKEIAEIEKKAEPFIKNGQTPGQCKSFDECQAYCNIEENFSECTAFEKKADIAQAAPPEQQAVFAAMQKGEGPGQCKDEASCRKYCEDIDHMEECLSFVEKFNLESPDNLKEMHKVSDAKKAGVAFPGNCKTKESCMAYCEGPAHAVECMEFGLKTGLMPKEDAEAVNKILPYLKSGGKLPGGCTTKESCDAYCENDANTNECADFAVAAGFVTKEEAGVMKKTGGKGPGNCKSRESCDTYCKDESHVDECIDFAVKAGFISQEDAAMAKKFGIMSGGPGGCKSKTECQSFCALPANQETCSSWGKEHGMDMGGGPGGSGGAGFSGPGGCKNKEECTAYCTTNQGDEACKKMIQEFGGGAGGGPGGQAGPGGCKSQEECMAYCKDHQEECKNFSPPGSGGGGQSQMPLPSSGGTGFSGPGGCKSQEECMTYCKDHMEECQKFAPPTGGGSSGGGGQIQPPANYSGPGGCNSPVACNAYCSEQIHQEECQKFVPPGSMIEPADRGFFAGVLSTFGPLLGIR